MIRRGLITSSNRVGSVPGRERFRSAHRGRQRCQFHNRAIQCVLSVIIRVAVHGGQDPGVAFLLRPLHHPYCARTLAQQVHRGGSEQPLLDPALAFRRHHHQIVPLSGVAACWRPSRRRPRTCLIFKALKQLLNPPQEPRKPIGFKTT